MVAEVTMASESSTGVYSIGAVAKMLGIPVQTLRAWEDRYKQVVPVRGAGGQRLYSRDDVERLRFIREQTGAGLQPADAHRLLAQRSRESTEHRDDDSPEVPDRAAAKFAVLVAERDPFAADFAEYFLRTEGYTVRIVLDVAEAARCLEDDRPTLLVVDLMISGGAGLALCRRARESGTAAILAISAIDSRDDALDCGADAFLQKPVDPDQLVATVRDLLGASTYARRGARV
jgi:DNA-binding transcriptional MerR regulator